MRSGANARCSSLCTTDFPGFGVKLPRASLSVKVLRSNKGMAIIVLISMNGLEWSDQDEDSEPHEMVGDGVERLG